MAGKLDGKIAVVTGSSAGIGLGTAKRFAAERAQVFITGRRRQEAEGSRRRRLQRDGHSGGHDVPFDIEGIYEVVRAKADHVDAANARFYKAFARFGSHVAIVEA
jgi:NAD(P)-dependent dehydrogenase (short-subunit alcohol dehydrogenase family)